MLKYYRNGRPIVESSGTDDKTEAKRILKSREGDIAKGLPLGPKVGRIRFEEAAEDIINDYVTNNRRSLDELERRIRLHLKPALGGRRMAAIATPEIRAFVARRQEAGASNGEINRELTVLKRMFTLAVQGGKLLHRPHIPMLREDNVRTGFFEREQLEALLPHLPGEIRPIVQFAYVTGRRIASEILPLEWRQVDLGAGEVRLDPGTTKNNEGRVFKLTPELRSLLECQKAAGEAMRNRWPPRALGVLQGRLARAWRPQGVVYVKL